MISNIQLNSYITNKHKRNYVIPINDTIYNDYYDYNTIIYDCFLSPKNDELFIIRPPLLNLKKFYSIKQIIFNNKVYKYVNLKISERCDTLCVKIDANNTLHDNILKIIFINDEVFECKLSKNNLSNSKNTIITMQKDNKLIWIKDWIEHYVKNFNIDRVIIYDNNSSYQKSLCNYLMENFKNSNLEIVLVFWNFKYGDNAAIHGNKFSRHGFINHALNKFKNKNILYQFDIDELAMCKDREYFDSLSDGVYYLNSFNVKNIPNNKLNNLKYTFKDYTIIHSESVDGIWKYIIKNYEKFNIGTNHYINNCRNKVFVDKNKLYFLHYNGITNFWHKTSKRELIHHIRKANIKMKIKK